MEIAAFFLVLQEISWRRAAAASSVAVEPEAADLARLSPEFHSVLMPALQELVASGGCPLAAGAFPPTPETTTAFSGILG
jgi:hypothetical protein